MARKIFTNNTDRIVYIGGRSVFPGSTREVDARDIPGHQAPAPAAPAEPVGDLQAAIDALLELSVADIRAALPRLEGELEQLLQSEVEGRNRKGVIQAIEAERLRRAAEATSDEDG